LHSSSGRRRLVRRVAQLVLAAVVVAFVVRAVGDQWGAVRTSAATLRPRPLPLVASALIVLGAYALLIETWRRTLRAWGEGLAFADAARIWFVSSFGKYVPGQVWAISAMAIMAGKSGVSPVAAAGSSVIVQLLKGMTPDLRLIVARAARQHVLAHFSHARFAEHHLALYHAVYSKRLAPAISSVGAVRLRDIR
jgi:hypothetical protein